MVSALACASGLVAKGTQSQNKINVHASASVLVLLRGFVKSLLSLNLLSVSVVFWHALVLTLVNKAYHMAIARRLFQAMQMFGTSEFEEGLDHTDVP